MTGGEMGETCPPPPSGATFGERRRRRKWLSGFLGGGKGGRPLFYFSRKRPLAFQEKVAKGQKKKKSLSFFAAWKWVEGEKPVEKRSRRKGPLFPRKPREGSEPDGLKEENGRGRWLLAWT